MNDIKDPIINHWFKKFKESLSDELNMRQTLDEEELNNLLTMIIGEYEKEFGKIYSKIFLYTYYKNILNVSMDKLLNFIKENPKEEKEEIIKLVNQNKKDTLFMYNLSYQDNCLVSGVTGKTFEIDYKINEILDSENVFLRPPRGMPNLRGPHATPTFEYNLNYWNDLKEDMIKQVKEFEKDDNLLEDLKDYETWLQRYRTLNSYIKLKKNLERNEKHVKN